MVREKMKTVAIYSLAAVFSFFSSYSLAEKAWDHFHPTGDSSPVINTVIVRSVPKEKVIIKDNTPITTTVGSLETYSPGSKGNNIQEKDPEPNEDNTRQGKRDNNSPDIPQDGGTNQGNGNSLPHKKGDNLQKREDKEDKGANNPQPGIAGNQAGRDSNHSQVEENTPSPKGRDDDLTDFPENPNNSANNTNDNSGEGPGVQTPPNSPGGNNTGDGTGINQSNPDLQ